MEKQRQGVVSVRVLTQKQLTQYQALCEFLADHEKISRILEGRMNGSRVDYFSNASILSKMTFQWVYPMMKKAFRHQIDIRDVPVLPDPFACEQSGKALLHQWDQSGRPHPLRSMLSAFRVEFFLALFFTLCWTTLYVLVPSFLFPGLMRFVQDPTQRTAVGWAYMASFCGAQVLVNVLYSTSWFWGMVLAMRVKSAMSWTCLSCVLAPPDVVSNNNNNALLASPRTSKRALSFSRTSHGAPSSQQGPSSQDRTGRFTNFIANDCERIFTLVHHIGYGTCGVAALIGLFVALFFYLGPYAALIALCVTLLSYPLQRIVSASNTKLRQMVLPLSDQRIQRTAEFIGAVRLVKLYAWEGPRASQIDTLRGEEIRLLARSSWLMSFSQAIVWICFWLSMWGSLSCYVLLGNTLSSATVFTILSLVGAVRFPLQMITITSFLFGDAEPSFRRLRDFLDIASKVAGKESAVVHSTGPRDEVCAELKNASLGYRKADAEVKPVVSEVNFQLRRGRVVCCVGAVGTGKSTLCSSLIGEADLVGGELNINQPVGIAQQSAWIMNATLRDNILFGLPYDEDRYRTVLRACQLETDLRLLPEGDRTLIGERGINLSGGQKQRVGVARAAYSDRPIILLDDPLSALDVRVGRSMFEQLVLGLLRDDLNKCVFLVTHQLQVCSQCDEIIVLDGGRQVQRGNYEALMQDQDGLFVKLMRDYTDVEEEVPQEELLAVQKQIVAQQQKQKQEADASGKLVLVEGGKEAAKQDVTGVGSVSLKVWKSYFMAIGIRNIWWAVSLTCIWTSIRVICDYWLVFLLQGALGLTRETFVWTWLLLNLGAAGFLVWQGAHWVLSTMRAGRVLHDRMFRSILCATMAFFDVTPSGRIVNRFSKDMDVVDKSLPASLDQFLQSIVQTLSIFIIIIVALPYFAIAAVPILLAFLLLGWFFRNTSTQLRRIDGVERGPLFSNLNEALDGRVTIRAFNIENLFLKRMIDSCNSWNSVVFSFWSTTRFFSLRLDLETSLVVLAVCIISVSIRSISPSLAGLALSYSLRLSALLQWGVRQFIESEAFMTSVEHIEDYIDNVPHESTSRGIDVPEGWIREGAIDFCNVTVKYGDNEVLKKLQLSIAPGEKVGIVGRTGAGKTSLVSAIFRLMECASGEIRIDGVDISTVSLLNLRSRLSIIPQDPVLFAGTLRSNLDPFGEHVEEELQDVCDRIHLDVDLEEEIENGGLNLSVGQRQLVCIGRAMLRKSRVLVVDEGTANIDTATDAALQKVMRREFRHATVLTVAHRINTVIDSDRVLVLDAGKVVEFAPPGMLVQRDDSRFRSLLLDTGASSSRHLMGIAMTSLQNLNPATLSRLQKRDNIEAEQQEWDEWVESDFLVSQMTL